MANPLPYLALAIMIFVLPLTVAGEVRDAKSDLNQGRLDEAASLLRAKLTDNPHDANAHQLLCRVFYAEELADRAIPECESALNDAANDAPLASENAMWLGRAYGLKAARANPISAFRIAKKVVYNFERSVQLNPANVPAFSDLGEYYVGAPSIVGGGLDKATALATRVMTLSATKAHRLLAMAAEKRGDNTTAEAEFKLAFDAQRTPQTLVDIADFYQRTKRCDQAVTTIKTLVRMDRARDAAIVDAASVLTACNQEPKLAIDLYTNYLASTAKSDSAPAPRVHVQLGDALAKAGDAAGARREYQAALTLASAYPLALKALQGQ
jgi:tetratricopeptide (TPR) repeat protein